MKRIIVGEYRIGGNLPGAPLFKLTLTFSDGGRVVGQGHITQATNPPLEISTYVSGRSELILWGADAQQIISLTGHEFATPMPPNPVNVECMISIGGKTPNAGLANYSYRDEKGDWVKLQNVPVTATVIHPGE